MANVYKGRKRNVDAEVHKAWRKKFSRGDVLKLCNITGYSAPVITAAVKLGFVNNPQLAEQITEYYINKPEAILPSNAEQLLNPNGNV